MDDPGLMGLLDCPGQGCQQLGRETRRLRGTGQAIVEPAALEQLQGDVRQTVCLADVVNLKDVEVSRSLDDRLDLGT